MPTDPLREAIERALPCFGLYPWKDCKYGHAADCAALNREAVYAAVAPLLAAERERREDAERDAARLDWLERAANEPGGLLLHDGTETGRTGLGLRPGALRRTLREAIDAAIAASDGEGK